MANCTFNDQLDAFHDGELDEPRRLAMENHLATCGACAEQLSRMRAMSSLFAAAEAPKLSQISLHRLHRRIDEAMDRGLIRIAAALSGIAASVLVIGSVWLARSNDVPQAAPPWVEVAGINTRLSQDTLTPAAEWYLADASGRTDDVP